MTQDNFKKIIIKGFDIDLRFYGINVQLITPALGGVGNPTTKVVRGLKELMTDELLKSNPVYNTESMIFKFKVSDTGKNLNKTNCKILYGSYTYSIDREALDESEQIVSLYLIKK